MKNEFCCKIRSEKIKMKLNVNAIFRYYFTEIEEFINVVFALQLNYF